MTATPFAGHEVPDRWVLHDPDAPVELGWNPQLQVAAPAERPAPSRRIESPVAPVTVSAAPQSGFRLPPGMRRWAGSLVGFTLGCAVIIGGLAFVDWYATAL